MFSDTGGGGGGPVVVVVDHGGIVAQSGMDESVDAHGSEQEGVPVAVLADKMDEPRTISEAFGVTGGLGRALGAADLGDPRVDIVAATFRDFCGSVHAGVEEEDVPEIFFKKKSFKPTIDLLNLK